MCVCVCVCVCVYEYEYLSLGKYECMCICTNRYLHLIQKRLSSELLHCAVRIVAYTDRKAPWM